MVTRNAVMAVTAFFAAPLFVAAQTGQQGQTEIRNEVRMMVTAAGSTSGGQGARYNFQGSTFTFVNSEVGFDSKVVKASPFSAETVTEFTQTLGNGQRIYRKSTGSVYRDSEGRTRRDQTIDAIGPFAAAGAAHQTILINDPVAGVNYTLDQENRTATRTAVDLKYVPVDVKVDEAPVKVEKGIMIDGSNPPGGRGLRHTVVRVETETYSQSESLGTQMIEGVQAEGTRTRETIPSGAIGNDSPIEIVSERWYSPELEVVVRSSHNDPMTGENVYTLQNIKRGEPSQSLFQVPPDYAVKEGGTMMIRIKK
jgi:hypothetical protein